MNNREQPMILTSAEAGPGTLQDFVGKIEEREAELLKDPEMKEHFTSKGANRHARPGNVPDAFRSRLQLRVRVANHLLLESSKEVHGSREELHRQESRAKLAEYFELKERLLARYAEAKDDKNLEELALVMENDMPFLKDLYGQYAEEVKETK